MRFDVVKFRCIFTGHDGEPLFKNTLLQLWPRIMKCRRCGKLYR